MPNPVQPLTDNEKKLVADLNKNKTRDWVLTELKEHLQTAIEIELATIPIYLFTYYSIVRNNESGETIERPELYANKAGGVIMSVAVEEMLHMSLSSNILYAMGVAPQLYGKAPAEYPTALPYHNPRARRVRTDRPGADPAREAQLRAALALPPDRISRAMGRAAAGPRLGHDRAILFVHPLPDQHELHHRRGLPAGRGRRARSSPTNTRRTTSTPSIRRRASSIPGSRRRRRRRRAGRTDKYPSAAEVGPVSRQRDSHAGPAELITVSSLQRRRRGDRHDLRPGRGLSGARCRPDAPDDDPSKDEASHYVKFLTLQAQFADYVGTHRGAAEPSRRRPAAARRRSVTDRAVAAAGLVDRFPRQPDQRRAIPARYRAIADFCSACFQYMLIMSETIYRVPPEQPEAVLQRRAAPLDDLGARQIYPHDPRDPDPVGRPSAARSWRRCSRTSISARRRSRSRG